MSNQEYISYLNGKIQVPNNPTIPFIEGDGIGIDISPIMKKVVNKAIKSAYNGERSINWLEIYAGGKACEKFDNNPLPEETLELIKKYKVAIKGPLMTPVGGGIRSLNVALRQKLDLYICQRPVNYFKGVPSPAKKPENVDMVIFRENSEDIYAGIEWEASSAEANSLINHLQDNMSVTNIRFPQDCGVGIKVISKEGSERLIRSAIEYAIENDKSSVTLVHKGNIMKFTEGAFKNWGYELAIREFGAKSLGDGWYSITNPNTNKEIIIKDAIADNFLQQILINPKDYSVIATMNLNGDYISDALAAQVGGIGIAPGANIGTEVALFEATHGTAPKHAGLNKANPSSLILSAHMMLIHMGWTKAANLLLSALAKAIANQQVTYDFARVIPGCKTLSTSDFGLAIESYL